MVGVWVDALVFGISDDDLRSFSPDHLDDAAHRSLERDSGEAGRGALREAHRAGIGIVQHDDRVVTHDAGRLLQLETPDLGDVRTVAYLADFRVEDAPTSSVRATDEDCADALVVVAGHAGGAELRFIVGVGVNRQQAPAPRHVVRSARGRQR
jgi:hypothetical protein